VTSSVLPHTRISKTVVASFAILMMLLALPMLASPAVAETSPLGVYGYVRDSANNPVVGASVLVWIVTPTNHLRTTTDSDGYYTVVFPMANWTMGNTITVTATSGLGTSLPNETTITDNPMEIWVDYSTAIPEFGSLMGALVAAVLVAVVAVVAIGTRRQRA